MSGSSYKHKSGATKRKEKDKREQEKTNLTCSATALGGRSLKAYTLTLQIMSTNLYWQSLSDELSTVHLFQALSRYS